MRTTIDISEQLLAEAMRASHARTKTTAITLGLQELINRRKLHQLRELRSQTNLTTDVRAARKR